MRPYLAIIKDSFRAAFASRVLYVLLALITVLLVAIAPFHYREVLDWKIKRDQHVQNPAFLVERLVAQKDDEGTGVNRIWELLPDSLHKDLLAIVERDDSKDQETSESDSQQSNVRIELTVEDEPRSRGPQTQGNPLEDFPVYDALIDELNDIIQDRDFYRSQDWENVSVSISPEATELIESGVENLTEERSRRLNRILIADAFGSAIQNGAATALDFYYLVWKIPIFSTNTTHQQFASTFSATIPWFFDKFVMSIGLFIAILVTANIIPETFDPGSLNLLLSKPITRWGLLIAKFIGGCAFVALCALYLFVGAWLWLGLGMGIWDRGILFAVPVYILVFAIYYSVSTLVGIWYRSAILSVILTGLFWAVCFGVGFSYGLLDNRMQNGEITKLVPVASGRLLQVDPLSKVCVWDEKENKWESALKPSMAQEQEIGIGIVLFTAPLGAMPTDMLGPIYDTISKRLISGSINLGDPRTFSQQECYVTDPDETNFTARGKFPRNAVALFATAVGPLSLNSSGEIFLLRPESLEGLIAEAPESVDDEAEKVAQDEESQNKAVQDKPKIEKKPELFEKYGTTKTTIRNGNYVDLNQTNQEIVVYRRGEIKVVRADRTRATNSKRRWKSTRGSNRKA